MLLVQLRVVGVMRGAVATTGNETCGRLVTRWLFAVDGLELVDWFFSTVMLFKKSHLFFTCLLLRFILIFQILHLFLKLFKKLLNCRLIFSS